MARLGIRCSLPPLILLLFLAAAAVNGDGDGGGDLRFRREGGTFKVLQVADMHYGYGRSTPC
jgi:hypothetical protein